MIETKCPYCGYIVDTHTLVYDNHKKSEDEEINVTICLKCGEALQIDKNLQIVKFDISILSFDEQEVIALLKEAHRFTAYGRVK